MSPFLRQRRDNAGTARVKDQVLVKKCLASSTEMIYVNVFLKVNGERERQRLSFIFTCSFFFFFINGPLWRYVFQIPGVQLKLIPTNLTHKSSLFTLLSSRHFFFSKDHLAFALEGEKKNRAQGGKKKKKSTILCSRSLANHSRSPRRLLANEFILFRAVW